MIMIEEQDFIIYEKGVGGFPLTTIKIPKECCGIKIEVLHSSIGQPDYLKSSCNHSPYYTSIWNNYHIKKIHIPIDMETAVEVIKAPITYGHNCTGCKQYSDYAAPNQNDGTFKCYGCRHPMF